MELDETLTVRPTNVVAVSFPPVCPPVHYLPSGSGGGSRLEHYCCFFYNTNLQESRKWCRCATCKAEPSDDCCIDFSVNASRTRVCMTGNKTFRVQQAGAESVVVLSAFEFCQFVTDDIAVVARGTDVFQYQPLTASFTLLFTCESAIYGLKCQNGIVLAYTFQWYYVYSWAAGGVICTQEVQPPVPFYGCLRCLRIKAACLSVCGRFVFVVTSERTYKFSIETQRACPAYDSPGNAADIEPLDCNTLAFLSSYSIKLRSSDTGERQRSVAIAYMEFDRMKFFENGVVLLRRYDGTLYCLEDVWARSARCAWMSVIVLT